MRWVTVETPSVTSTRSYLTTEGLQRQWLWWIYCVLHGMLSLLEGITLSEAVQAITNKRKSFCWFIFTGRRRNLHVCLYLWRILCLGKVYTLFKKWRELKVEVVYLFMPNVCVFCSFWQYKYAPDHPQSRAISRISANVARAQNCSVDACSATSPGETAGITPGRKFSTSFGRSDSAEFCIMYWFCQVSDAL